MSVPADVVVGVADAPDARDDDERPAQPRPRNPTVIALVLVAVGLSGVNERVVASTGWSTGGVLAWYAAMAALGAAYLRWARDTHAQSGNAS